MCLGPYRLEDAIDGLVEYSLMKRKSPTDLKKKASDDQRNSGSLWLHPLVQIWARDSYCDGTVVVLERDPKRLEQLRKERAVDAIRLVGNSVEPAYATRQAAEWVFERGNIAHLSLCVDHYFPKYIVGNGDLVDESLALALRKLARLKVFWDDYKSAADLFKESIRVYERLLPESTAAEIGLLMAKQELVSMYIARNQTARPYPEVSSLVHEVAEKQTRLLGEFNHETLWSMVMKAAWMSYGRNPAALQALLKCVENNEAHLPKNSPFYIQTFSFVASAYHRLGQYDKAVEMNQRLSVLNVEHFGLCHQNTVIGLWNLALMVINYSGDHKKACSYLEQCTEGYKGLYGVAHKDTLEAMLTLRTSYRKTGQKDKALDITKRYLLGWEKLHGKRHVDHDSMLWLCDFVFRPLNGLPTRV